MIMRIKPRLGIMIIFLFFYILLLCGNDKTAVPVTPEASAEAKALLKFLYDISGKYTLTGQHNYPNTKSRNSRFAARYLGKTPIVFSTDLGHAKDGDTDSYLARPDIVKEVIRQHQLGAIITICWHAVPPTADEPVTFRPLPGAPAESLASVQGQLTDRQFKNVLTPGSNLYHHWCDQVDSIAFYLKQLQEEHIPILWRPYHEMNGDWFWWGGRTGEYSTAALYRQLFERLVNHHQLNNLIWVWNVDRPNKPEMRFKHYFPGIEYVDILSLDVYRRDFNQSYYNSLTALSDGKPLVLGEVGNPPSPAILKDQPNWTLYVTWAGMVRNTLKKEYRDLFNDPRILNLEDPAYWKVIEPYRLTCKLPPLPSNKTTHEDIKLDFSGEWIFNENKSTLDHWGSSNLPYKLEISRQDNQLNIKKTFIIEYAVNKTEEENLIPGGKEIATELQGFPRITTASWNENGDTLRIKSKVIRAIGGQSVEMMINESWGMQEHDTILTIKHCSSSFCGKREIILVYKKLEFCY